MAEPFKNKLNSDVVTSMATAFKQQWAGFDDIRFVHDVNETLESLELKQRTQHITQMMCRYLPTDFEHASEILLGSLGEPLGDDLSVMTMDNKGISGWAITSLTYYVALNGPHHFDLSMHLLKEMTKRFTSEFDIRYFLTAFPQKTEAVLRTWAQDDNQHVRRLASEGCRPRLPWGMKLSQYVDDPSPIIAILELLKDDEKEYVRRSVANNLNDIAKDHPERVVILIEQWLIDASAERQKLLKHACRTLIKQGHKKALQLFGFDSPLVTQAKVTLSSHTLVFGEAIGIIFSMTLASKNEQALLIDYIIHHQKANGSTTAKVFKWKTSTVLAGKTLTITKKHSIKKISTRRYYAGKHKVEVMVNGVVLAESDFQLLM